MNSLVSVEGVVADVDAASVARLLDGSDVVLDATRHVRDAVRAERSLRADGHALGVRRLRRRDWSDVRGPAGRDALPALRVPRCPAGRRRPDLRHGRRARPDRRRDRLAAGGRGAQDRGRPAPPGRAAYGRRRRLGHRPAHPRTAATRPRLPVLRTATVRVSRRRRRCDDGRALRPRRRPGARPRGTRLDLEALATRLAPLGRVEGSDAVLRAWIGEHRLVVFADGRAIVAGTDDPAVARSLYARSWASERRRLGRRRAPAAHRVSTRAA